MSTSEDREKTRHRLRELAEAAMPAPADSSGYVDLSAYSATDPDWVEHALARSREGAAPSPAPALGSRAAGSVAPLEIPKPADSSAPARSRRRTLTIASGILAGATAAIAAIVLLVLDPFALTGKGGGHGRDPAKQVAAAAPPAVPPSAAAAAPAPSPPASTASLASAGSAAPSASAASTSAPSASAPIAAAAAPSAPAVRPRAPAAAPRPRGPSRASSGVSKGKPAGGGDALTNAMLQSISEPGRNKK